MRVFSNEWVEGIKRRYERLPPYQRPVIYSIAVDKDRESLRSEIEAWVERLPSTSREKLIPRLRSPRNIQQSYNELAVGHTLIEFGYELEYEQQIDGLTPDWFVHSRGEAPAFVIEAFTANAPENRVADINKCGHLIARLHSIPVDVTLRINTDTTGALPDQRESKRIKDAVERWLTSDIPTIGSRMNLSGLTFEVVRKNSNNQHVLCIGPVSSGHTFWVNTEPLKKNITDKVKKYRVLGSKGIPLVVGIVADFFTALSRDDLENVLFGDEAIQLLYEESTGDVVGQRTIRHDNGLFVEIDPALSAIMWVSREAGTWKAEAIHNPGAVNPLPLTTFEQAPSRS